MVKLYYHSDIDKTNENKYFRIFILILSFLIIIMNIIIWIF